jgi:hypothetical protein
MLQRGNWDLDACIAMRCARTILSKTALSYRASFDAMKKTPSPKAPRPRFRAANLQHSNQIIGQNNSGEM